LTGKEIQATSHTEVYIVTISQLTVVAETAVSLAFLPTEELTGISLQIEEYSLVMNIMLAGVRDS
jgi:hypothetical protein